MTTEDNSWVFDSLVCFLHGPIWNAPLQTFIEEKSLIFDPNEENIDENDENIEYKRIHDEYKNLVDFMLGSFMEEMQITPELFELACLEGRQNGTDSSLSFHHGLFQQIWAANDIKIFIRMMTQRNVELQLQALDLIERRQNSLQDENNGNSSEKTSSSPHQIDDTDDVQQRIEKLLIENDDETEKEIIESIEKETAGGEPQAMSMANAQKKIPIQQNNEEKFKRLNLFFEQDKVSSADVKSRQEYLRAQRDKILDIKKKARAHQLHESVKRNGRPTSAQAAEKILQASTSKGGGGGKNGKTIMDDKAIAGITTAETELSEASLQLRKALAKRLRSEVIDRE